jgi:calcineurin-like phosphoesterase family protein
MGNIRILHTADNHIGLKFNNYGGTVAQSALVQERFDALKNVMQTSNDKDAHFLVVAGDLFDDLKVTQKDIKAVVEILKKSKAEVLVLPGNHDYYDGKENKLWKAFSDFAENTNLKLLLNATPYETEVDGTPVCFYPAPCGSKHHEGHVIGWVGDVAKAPNTIHIGLAHGNVEGMGVDDTDRYFNMSEGDLRAAGVDFWLLGHIHVPYPPTTAVGNPLYFMPATHTPESVKRKIPGFAWFIEVNEQKQLRYEQITTGNLRFSRQILSFGRTYTLSDFQQQELGWRNAQLILDLKLSGSLSQDELSELQKQIKSLSDHYLYIDCDNQVGVAVDTAFIQNTFAEGTSAYQWLTAISEEPDSDLALQLAFSIIQKHHSA